MSELKYSIITEIKNTDKSKVYLASIEGYDFPVILKKIRHGNIQVFRALKEINCEQLPKIFYVEETVDGLLVAEEYVEGELLTEYLSSGKLTETQCLDIASELCAVLEILHNHKPALIHRDIKPSNIIINSKGKVKLIDFDSTRLYKEESDGDTRLLGTEKYAAPEQYGFSQTDSRSDIYSLGVVFEKFTDIFSQKKQKQWKRIVEKCTLFSPDSRFQCVGEIKERLKKIKKADFFSSKAIIFVCALVVCAIVAVTVVISKSRAKEDLEPSETVFGSANEASTETITDATTNSTEETTTAPTEETTTEQVSDESYKTTPPEWRDLDTDEQNIVDLKNEIRTNNAVVMYHFKDRMQEQDFLLQIRDLESSTVTLNALNLASMTTGNEVTIDVADYELVNNVIVISKDYMNSLEEGYYLLGAELSRSDGGQYRNSAFLYVSPSDVLEEPQCWLQNTTFDYSASRNEKIHAVLRNDSAKKITALNSADGYRIDAAMYEIQQGGRVVELSNDLMSNYTPGEAVNFYVECSDGSYIDVYINVIE